LFATHRRPALLSYRDFVTYLMRAGKPFHQVEEAIDAAALNDDQKAGLWLLAFSMRDPREQQADAHAQLALLAHGPG
jgi:hypothetical protein